MMRRRVLLVLSVTLLGVLGGAVAAAPRAVWALTTHVAQQSAVLARTSVNATMAAVPSTGAVRARLVGDGSPRRLAMLAAGTLLLVSGVSLLALDLRHRLARRRGAELHRPGTVRATTTRSATSGAQPAVRRTRRVRWPSALRSPVPMAPARRAARSVTPVQVRAMADDGSSPADIAYATGLPLDAVALLLAVAPAPASSAA
jgi:hypothetical protein